MKKYTVIYTKRWTSGSHWHALTRMEKVEVEENTPNLLEKLTELVGTNDIQYVFEGHPKMIGEQSATLDKV